VAADVVTGEEVIMSTGSVAEAVRASASIPAVVEPAFWNGHYLIDGGSVNPVPASVLAGEADIIIAVSVIPSLTDRLHRRELLESGRVPNLLAVFFGDREIMEAGIIESRMGQVDVLIQPDVTRFGTFDWETPSVDEMIAEGERAARRMLPDIQACLRPRAQSGPGSNGQVSSRRR
jgi:NTE family protein